MSICLRRRNFITLLGGAAVWPLAGRAQQPALPVIGFLNAGSPTGAAEHVRAFKQGLSEGGFMEGGNVAIEYRWAYGEVDRLPALVTDLSRRHVTVMTTSGGGRPELAAKAAMPTTPLVFSIPSDPVEAGLVASFNRPGGNFTGVTTLSTDLVPKRLQILHEAVPEVSTIGVLLNSKNRGAISKELHSAANALGLKLTPIYANGESDLDATFERMNQMRVAALMIPPDTLFLDQRARLGALTLRHAIPTIHSYHEFTEAGGLMTYGGKYEETMRQIGVYTGRILKGDKPADLPVQQMTKVEFIINLKTARALGVNIPLTLRGRADDPRLISPHRPVTGAASSAQARQPQLLGPQQTGRPDTSSADRAGHPRHSRQGASRRRPQRPHRNRRTA
jgi:putative ABC transport system substrate-binding protein